MGSEMCIRDSYTYGPKLRFLHPMGRIHIDDLPTEGSFERLPLGVHAPIADTDDEVDVMSDPLDRQSTIGGPTVQVPSSTTSASSSLQYPEPLASVASQSSLLFDGVLALGPLASGSSRSGSLTRDQSQDPDARCGGSPSKQPHNAHKVPTLSGAVFGQDLQPNSSGRAHWADITEDDETWVILGLLG